MASKSPIGSRDGNRRQGYRVRWREWDNAAGRRKNREATVYGKAEAEALVAEKSQLEREQIEAIKTGDEVGQRTATPIGEGIGRWLQHYASLDSVGKSALDHAKREAKIWILPQLREWGVEFTGDITIKHLRRLRDERILLNGDEQDVQSASIGTKNRLVSVLQALSRDMVHLGLLDEDVAAGKYGLKTLTVPTTRTHIPSIADVNAIKVALDQRAVAKHGDEKLAGWRPSLIVDLLALSCCRYSEAAGLEPTDLVLGPDRRHLRVHRVRLRDGSERCAEAGQPGKTLRAWREVTVDAMLQETVDALSRYSQPMACGGCGQMTSGRLMCDWQGKPFGYETFARQWRAASKVAAVEHFELGNLRHLGISRIIKAGGSPYQAMKLAGHSKLETTVQTYADLWPSDHGDLAKVLDEFGWGK